MNLILRHEYTGPPDGKTYVSTMKLKPMPDGTCHVWVNNGDDRFSQFRIDKANADKLIAFLQCNIK